MFDEFSFETLHHNAFRLTLKNYRLPVEIGALAEEHGRTQPVVITIDVWVKKTNLNDDLAAAYDYRLLPGYQSYSLRRDRHYHRLRQRDQSPPS